MCAARIWFAVEASFGGEASFGVGGVDAGTSAGSGPGVYIGHGYLD